MRGQGIPGRQEEGGSEDGGHVWASVGLTTFLSPPGASGSPWRASEEPWRGPGRL